MVISLCRVFFFCAAGDISENEPVAFVVIGIAVAVAAVHFTGGSTRAKLAVPEQALDRFREDFPDEKIAAVYRELLGDTGAPSQRRIGHLTTNT